MTHGRTARTSAAASERPPLDPADNLAAGGKGDDRDEGARRGRFHQRASAETFARPGASSGRMRSRAVGAGWALSPPDDVKNR